MSVKTAVKTKSKIESNIRFCNLLRNLVLENGPTPSACVFTLYDFQRAV